jgi:hypothetical protein
MTFDTPHGTDDLAKLIDESLAEYHRRGLWQMANGICDPDALSLVLLGRT